MFKTTKRIIDWCGPYKKRLYLGFVCAFFATWFGAAPTMVAAFALGKVIDSARTGTAFDTSLIGLCIAAVIVLVLLRFLFSYWRAKLQESIGYELAAEQRIKIGDILKRVSLGYFQEHSAGDILSTVTTELSSLEYQGMRMINEVVNGYINVVAIILCLGVFSIPAALVAVAGVLLSLLFLHGVSVQSEKNAPINEQAVEDMSGAVIEYVRGLPIVKSFGQEGASIASMKQAVGDSRDINIKIEKGFTPFNCLHLFSLKLASVGLVLVTAWMTYCGQMELPIMLMFCMFSFTIFGSVEAVNDSAHVLGAIDSAMNKLEEMQKAVYIDEGGSDIMLASHDIEFQHVTFGYDRREVLHDISFKIPQNTTTAIVGPSGSGKSTLCNLIARFYDVSAGAVKIGGRNVKDFTCDSLLRNISMVFQNVYLFHDTVKNNIRFGNPNATDEEIIEAAKKARCHDFILSMPDGYDTMVGEGGSSLSGGEKQRISIARAILKDSPIVILDEATASIDPENEHLIQEAISALTHGKTIITIAHRLATIQSADKILVVDGGGIAQQGTHDELMAQEGVYKRFIEIREKAEGWSIG
ncbi:MAG: ABC transporter ATP-binding protein [Lachnospiraceae bacterium]|nr:ABC transporter ATP-binding protein [Lachnospiraceae bacterium]